MEQKINPEIVVGLAFFFAAGLVAVGLLYPTYIEMKDGDTQVIAEPIVTPLDDEPVVVTPPVSVEANSTSTLSMNEVVTHASEKSCWFVISGKVYDVTSFPQKHPGGAEEVLESCGTDATVAFNTQDGEGKHSSLAIEMLKDFYIGDLGKARLDK